ncbi:MAG TPA: SIMPL domain-containing protein [Blastocatellia bacterium]|nr:SIMPL domain-containing protein [Blastocatellia bacterium]
MKRCLSILAWLLVAGVELQAQISGNAVYSEPGRKPAREAVNLGASPLPDNSGLIIPAHVQINVRADEHVAFFGLSQEGRTIQDCNRKLELQIESFTGELKSLGVKAGDVAVDHTTQARTYDYEIAGNVAQEKATGFVVKKTVSVHFKEKEWMDRLLGAAAKANVYDLIKVDYLVNDVAAIRERLLEESARIIREKAGRYEKLLGVKFRSQIQILQETHNATFPTEAYQSYLAYESGRVNDRTRVKEARKSETFFFNAQNAGNFDQIINPAAIEPVVQFSLYLQIKYLFDR